MNTKITIVFFLLFCVTHSFSQVSDTIYFKKDWEVSNSKDYYYYRIAEKTGENLMINDYYKNGILQYTGIIEGDFDRIYSECYASTIGVSHFFDKKGRRITSEDRDVGKYFKQVPSLNTPDLKKALFSGLSFQTNYYTNGEVKSKGFISMNCKRYFKWLEYNIKGKRLKASTYKNGILDGRLTTYYRGNPYKEWNYINDLKHGEFKEFNPSDQVLLKEGNYQYGKKHGAFKYYNWPDGSLIKTVMYNEGKKISETKTEASIITKE